MLFLTQDLDHDCSIFITKASYSSLARNISSILNVILFLTALLFIMSLLHFINIKDNSPIIPTNIATVANKSGEFQDVSTKRCYYDYDCFSKNMASNKENRTRRYFYIDLGCFDGRDIDYFLHFYEDEMSKLGTITIFAFEPDPINFSACKLTQARYNSYVKEINNAAVWIEKGEVRYATERGQKSKIDQSSALQVQSIDFSTWLKDNFNHDDYVYVKFTIEGVEIPILEKLVRDETLALIDHMEIEWHDDLSYDLEPRRIALECMFDNFGMDFLYMINPVDLRHTYNVKGPFSAVPKDKGWKLKDPLFRFHYKTRKDVSDLITDRLKKKAKKVFF